MKKEIIEFKKGPQIYSPSQEIPAGVISGHILTGNLSRRRTIARCGQFFVAALLAGGLYFLNLWAGGGGWLLAALAATSAFAYVGLAIESRTVFLALLNLFAAPILFATAYAGMSIASEWLIVSFLLHGSVTAVQLSSIDKDLSGALLFWSAFNSAMALFLLLG